MDPHLSKFRGLMDVIDRCHMLRQKAVFLGFFRCNTWHERGFRTILILTLGIENWSWETESHFRSLAKGCQLVTSELSVAMSPPRREAWEQGPNQQTDKEWDLEREGADYVLDLSPCALVREPFAFLISDNVKLSSPLLLTEVLRELGHLWHQLWLYDIIFSSFLE